MEVLSFKIKGKTAHFRKYFANNTAFSFSIPPRTTIMGILAAAMGLRRDSYYEDFCSENIRIAVRVLSPIKKSFHRLNFISLKSLGDMSKNWSNDFRGKDGRIQTPFEIVTPWDISTGNVEYQIFVTDNNLGNDVFERVKNHFLHEDFVYNITLGIANFNAQVYDIELLESDRIHEKKSDDFIEISSAVPVDFIDKFEFKEEDFTQYNFVEEDMLPADFVANENREVSKMNKLLFPTTPNPLRLKLNTSFFELNLNNEDNINIVFMDE